MNYGYISPAEVAERLGVTARTVRNLISDGKLQAIRVGSVWRIRTDWFDALERKLINGSKAGTRRAVAMAKTDPATER